MGYLTIMQGLTTMARSLANQIKQIDGGEKFELISKNDDESLPIVVWRLRRKYGHDGISPVSNYTDCEY